MNRAFISYSRKDTAFVEKLEHDLNGRGIVTWRDATSIPGGDDWYRNIEQGLTDAYTVICIVTPNADESKWVRREQLRADEDGIPLIAVQPAKHRNPLHLQEIQPILMDDANYASGMAQLSAALARCQLRPLKPASASVSPAVADVPLADAIREYLKWVLSEAKADLRDALYVDLAATPERSTTMRPKSALAFGLDDDIFTFAHVSLEHLAHDDFAKPGEDVPDARKAIQELRRTVLLGDPGAGKTTTLLKITVDLARAAEKDPDAKLPVYIPLREFDGGGGTSFAEFARSKAYNLQSSFDSLLKDGRFVLLCDALNEMPRQAADEHDLVAEVRDYLKDKPNWVVSCRVRDYQDDLSGVEDVGKIQLKPLDPPRIEEFIRRKYTGWEQSERGAALWTAIGGNDKLLSFWRQLSEKGETERFWDRWAGVPDYTKGDEDSAWRRMHDDHRRLLSLCRNPFMTNMVCALYRTSGTLPENRAGLFADFVANLFKHERARLEAVGLTWIGDEPIRAGMGQIAWAMGAQTELARDIAEMLLRQHVPDHDPARLLSAAASAQIIDYGTNVRFTHQLLQQYFAASVLGKRLDDKADPADIWLPETWWQATGREETGFLLAGDRNDPESVARWLAPAQPELACELLTQPDFNLDVTTITATTREALIKGANGKIAEANPIGRAAAYRVLGTFDADPRKGIGIIVRDGFKLPDIDWVEIPDDGEWTYQAGKHPGLPAFQISRYPLTFSQFQTFIDDKENGFTDPRWWEGLADDDYRRKNQSAACDQAFKFANHPRENVSWYDAIAFCRWWSWRVGGGYDLDKIEEWAVRLPTEYEWEKAARGTDGRIYPYGNEFDAGKGNTSETGIGQTSAVGIFPAGASPYGVLDMSGNVWEWCLTDYNHPVVETAMENLRTDVRRVLRGGSWRYSQYDARAVYRRFNFPNNRDDDNGFRVVAAVLLE